MSICHSGPPPSQEVYDLAINRRSVAGAMEAMRAVEASFRQDMGGAPAVAGVSLQLRPPAPAATSSGGVAGRCRPAITSPTIAAAAAALAAAARRRAEVAAGKRPREESNAAPPLPRRVSLGVAARFDVDEDGDVGVRSLVAAVASGAAAAGEPDSEWEWASDSEDEGDEGWPAEQLRDSDDEDEGDEGDEESA